MVPWAHPNGISIGAAVFAGLTSVRDRPTDRPTDHATRSVTIGRIYVRSTARRPNDTNANITQFSMFSIIRRGLHAKDAEITEDI